MTQMGRALGLALVGLAFPVAVQAKGAPPAAVVRAAGEITAVSTADSTFTLHSRRGNDLTYLVDADTQSRSRSGEVRGLADLEPGMLAGVAAEQQEDGTLLALHVAAASKGDVRRFSGVVVRVVPGQGTFTLETTAGAVWEFHTGDRTRFRSRDGSLQSIHDLKKGMTALVAAIREGDDGWFALLVAARAGEDRPLVDVRQAGTITRLGVDDLTLQTREGETVTVFVDQQERPPLILDGCSLGRCVSAG